MSTLVNTEVLGLRRVLPYSHDGTKTPRITPLSIIDATVVSYSPAAAAWLYDALPAHEVFDPHALAESLALTMDAYPQWAGQLGWASYDPTGEGGHTKRFRRVQLTWGGVGDPGVDFVTAVCQGTLAALIPSAEERIGHHLQWDAGVIRDLQLLPQGLAELALRDVAVPERRNTPSMIVQITTFACGGVSIAVGMAHALADATTLVNFVRDWASVHRAHVNQTPIPPLNPVFDPAFWTTITAGDIDAKAPDPAIQARVRQLPLHDFDYFNSEAGAPSWAANAVVPPSEYTAPSYDKPGDPLPWHEWDSSVPVQRYILHFTPAAIAKMHDMASSTGRVSRLDALLAFIWTLIARARGLEGDDGQVYLDMTLGARGRTNPPLPANFLGSPLINFYASAPAVVAAAPASTPDLSSLAQAIRAAISAFDSPTALPAYLHDRAFLGCPHARWIAFMGLRHTIVTSWLGLDVYKIDFGGGRPARHVESVMPDADGCVQIMEAGYLDQERPGFIPEKWYETTVGVRVHVREDVMQRILQDELLQTFGHAQETDSA